MTDTDGFGMRKTDDSAKTKALKGKGNLLSDKEAVKRFHAHQAKIKTMSPTNPDHPDYGK